MERKDEIVREADRQHAEAVARLEHTVSLARGGLQAAMLANGGALIGLFTIVAPNRDLAVKLWGAGLTFSVALTLTLFAWFFATFSQDRLQIACMMQVWQCENELAGRKQTYPVNIYNGLGNAAIYLAFGFAALSFVAFLTGCLLTLKALA